MFDDILLELQVKLFSFIIFTSSYHFLLSISFKRWFAGDRIGLRLEEVHFSFENEDALYNKVYKDGKSIGLPLIRNNID